jgi:hypothetical protein
MHAKAARGLIGAMAMPRSDPSSPARFSWGFFIAAVMLAAAGCTSAPPADPVDTALNAERSVSQRIRAIQQIPDPQTDRLYTLVWYANHRIEIRAAAVDRLLQAQPQRFWQQVDTNYRRVDDWPMITLLCERASEQGEQAFVATAIKSWARPSVTYSDTDRPERAALMALVKTNDAQAYLAEVCRGSVQAPLGDRDVRVAAWSVYCRVVSDAQARALITQRKADDPLLGQLAIIEPTVERLPADDEALHRLDTLVARSSADTWQERAAYRQRVTDDPVTNLAARHLPAIDRGGDRLLMDRASLLEALRTRLAGADHRFRGEDADGAYAEPRPELLEDHADRLSHADLLVLHQISDALQLPELIEVLHAQATADYEDRTSELGGVLTWDDHHRVVAEAYPPALRRHDRMYIASDACVLAMHTGLAHYHFHAQEYDTSVWAGPGRGDLDFADRMHANCVVFTFVDQATLNVDVYFPGDVIVDLGCVSVRLR